MSCEHDPLNLLSAPQNSVQAHNLYFCCASGRLSFMWCSCSVLDDPIGEAKWIVSPLSFLAGVSSSSFFYASMTRVELPNPTRVSHDG